MQTILIILNVLKIAKPSRGNTIWVRGMINHFVGRWVSFYSVPFTTSFLYTFITRTSSTPIEPWGLKYITKHFNLVLTSKSLKSFSDLSTNSVYYNTFVNTDWFTPLQCFIQKSINDCNTYVQRQLELPTHYSIMDTHPYLPQCILWSRLTIPPLLPTHICEKSNLQSVGQAHLWGQFWQNWWLFSSLCLTEFTGQWQWHPSPVEQHCHLPSRALQWWGSHILEGSEKE